jgi:hypothetical protein
MVLSLKMCAPNDMTVNCSGRTGNEKSGVYWQLHIWRQVSATVLALFALPHHHHQLVHGA